MYEHENLYRGKRTDNGEWIQGGLIRFCGLNLAAILESNAKVFMPTGSTVFCTNSCFDIIPETAGRYTGKDLDGEKLFTGDIVESYENYDDIWGYPTTNVFKSVVIWDKENFCYAFDTDGHIQAFNDWEWENSRIVGNIHDNPELLKGGADNE